MIHQTDRTCGVDQAGLARAIAENRAAFRALERTTRWAAIAAAALFACYFAALIPQAIEKARADVAMIEGMADAGR